ncbi:MAG: hypothetical protein HC780_27715 [Leptolyngbyaceae cyanobacterium CSU_1_3]|nr:hypothetical protein [Leptolyngbyaceae cyanobacterium CSU_1_3]
MRQGSNTAPGAILPNQPSKLMYTYQAFQADAELLYNHLLMLRKQESPGEVVQHFYHLFIARSGYPKSRLSSALDRIVTSSWSEREFSHILNRCCYILINYWWLQSEFKSEFKQATLNLVQLFQGEVSRSHDPLSKLIAQFAHTSQYEALRRRAWAADDDTIVEPRFDRSHIGPLIHRYPFLYSYYLLDEDTSDLGQEAVRRLQAQKENQFEANLLSYAHQLFVTPLSTAHNPTLLSAHHLQAAIVQFVGIESLHPEATDLHLASQISQAPSYGVVKQQIQDYLIESIYQSHNPRYGNHHFNDWLREQLKNTMPQFDHVKPDSRLIEQTCTQLIESLIASPAQINNHLMFIDLNSNLGATLTIGLVLKIALLCRSVKTSFIGAKSRIARQFATIFRHYETSVRADLGWLIECLDTFMVAFTILFWARRNRSLGRPHS